MRNVKIPCVVGGWLSGANRDLYLLFEKNILPCSGVQQNKHNDAPLANFKGLTQWSLTLQYGRFLCGYPNPAYDMICDSLLFWMSLGYPIFKKQVYKYELLVMDSKKTNVNIAGEVVF